MIVEENIYITGKCMDTFRNEDRILKCGLNVKLEGVFLREVWSEVGSDRYQKMANRRVKWEGNEIQ